MSLSTAPALLINALAVTIVKPLRSNRLRNKPYTKPFSVEKYTTTANYRRMRQSTYLSLVDLPVVIRSFL